MRALMVAALLTCTFSGLGSVAQAQEPAPIADNSFLIEEAYNQEARVVQHISAFFWSEGGWWYTFTQEWPVFGQRSQLSYTVPLLDGGLGDFALNYRLQLVARGNVAVSPRLTVILPTGRWQLGRGSGAAGIQVNLPVSARLSKRLVTHWNAGGTVTPNSRFPGGGSTVWAWGLGVSAIYEPRHDLNVLVEMSWSGIEGNTEGLINPGIRWAHNLKNGLQIVPGIAVPISLWPESGAPALFLYLSFEHAF